MNYQQTLNFLYAHLPMYQKLGSVAFKKDITNIYKLCNFLNNPQKTFKSIHIAGTNGKGSTSHLIASILQSKGYKIGLYTSPHLKSFTERIKVNGIELPEDFIVSFIEKIKPLIEDISPSFFEITVAMAFVYFKKENVDFAIVETGLGGRLDSTNIINPELCLITNISHDHEAMLGNSVVAIAKEKAGIIKPNTPIIISETQHEVKNVFIKRSKELHAPLFFADEDFQFEKKDFEEILLLRNKEPYLKFYPSLKGIHQIKNTIGVVKLLEIINEKFNLSFTKDEIKNGLENVTSLTAFKGRWQKVGEKPLIICDIAHNKQGIKVIVKQIKNEAYNHLHIVLGTVNDKNISEILSFFPKEATYYFCKPNVARGLDVNILKTEAKNFELNGKSYSSVNDAIRSAKSKALKDDLIFIGGSTFVVAEIEGL